MPVSRARIDAPGEMGAGAPKNGTGIPVPVMSRSLTMPTDSPRRSAARSGRRASFIGTMVMPTRPRDAMNQRRNAGSATSSIGAVTGRPTRWAT